MRSRAGGFLFLVSLLGCAGHALLPPGVQQDLVFDRYTPLSRAEEIARRTLTPLTFAAAQRGLASRREALIEQPIDLSRETFSVYVPGGPAPKNGYGLLVFVPPWDNPTRPTTWERALDRHGVILVAAARSGNDQNVLDRRLPLALLAYENVRVRYPVDPNRVYVGGLSGGSRVAEIAALAYPDVFKGALLNAGSEPIGGEAGIYLPPADLFRQVQSMRLVYATGEHDARNLQDDERSRDSLREFCVFDLEVNVAHGLGHEPLDAISMEHALEALDRRSPPEARKLASCRARVQQELSARLADAAATLARGDRDGARALILAIDRLFGGLSAPAILDLDARCRGTRPR